MTIKTKLNAAVTNIFTAFESVSKTVLYMNEADETLAAGGIVTRSYTEYSLSAIFGSYTNMEIGSGSVQGDDVKMMLDASTVTFTPGTKDIVVLENSNQLQVVNAKLDPSESLWVFQLRQ